MKKILFSLLLLGAVTSCIYSYDPDISDSEVNDILVVDGEIIIGDTSVFQLSRVSSITETVPATPRGRAWVEDDAGNRYNSLGKVSAHIIVPTESAPMDRRYRAHILVDDQEYVSEWLSPKPAPVIKDVHFTADEANVHVQATLDAGEEGTGYIGINFEETWEFHSEFEVEYTINTKTWQYDNFLEDYPYYWCFMYQEPSDMFLINYSKHQGTLIHDRTIRSFPRSNNRNHKKYSILVKARALSKEAFTYRDYIQSMTNTGGDLFTPEPGTLNGNLHCESDENRQVLGLVQASVVSSKRAFMGAEYLIERAPDESILQGIPDNMRKIYYELGYRPVKQIPYGGNMVVGWGPERCINCIVAGGVQKQPSYWN